MMSVLAEVHWSDPEVSVPPFLTMMAIPLTFSIANGLAFGLVAYTLIKVLRREFRLTAIFTVRLVYQSHIG